MSKKTKIIFLLLFITFAFSTPLDDISLKLRQGIYSIEYGVHTSDNKLTMDCLKINYDNQFGDFGIFHAHNQTTHFSQLFYSQFGKNKWENTVKISERGSQGTVMRVNINQNKYGYFIGYQLQNPNGNKIAIRYYQNQQKIKINNFLYEYQLIPIVSNKQVKNVGTVSLEEIQLINPQSDPKFNQYRLMIKFHYSPDGSHDFPGQGYVNIKPLRDFVDNTGKWRGGCIENYRDWQGLSDTVAEAALRQAGCLGKIGQRDLFFLGSEKYYLYECNLNPSFDWYSWRIAIYSPTLKQAKPFAIVLDGDVDIANPHISLVTKINNTYEFTMTFFLPSQGISPDRQAKAGESIVKTKFTYP